MDILGRVSCPQSRDDVWEDERDGAQHHLQMDHIKQLFYISSKVFYKLIF